MVMSWCAGKAASLNYEKGETGESLAQVNCECNRNNCRKSRSLAVGDRCRHREFHHGGLTGVPGPIEKNRGHWKDVFG
jgi:hypothetical protein